jgi:hypothetical protein
VLSLKLGPLSVEQLTGANVVISRLTPALLRTVRLDALRAEALRAWRAECAP